VCSEYDLFLCVIRLLLELSYGCQLITWFSLLIPLSLGFPLATSTSVLDKLLYLGANTTIKAVNSHAAPTVQENTIHVSGSGHPYTAELHVVAVVS